MFDIMNLISQKKKKASNGWYSFNCPFCVHMGHSADKRSRGGLKFTENDSWVYHCFNCDFKSKFDNGTSIAGNTKKMLLWLGSTEEDILRWNLEILKNKENYGLQRLTAKKVNKPIIFSDFALPDNAEMLDPSNENHLPYCEYLLNRKIDIHSYPFLVTPHGTNRDDKRIIIPYTYENKIVGYTSKYIDGKLPKYINNHQYGYVFGTDNQLEKSSVVIVTEGIFDALSIGGCAVLHDDINEGQAQILSRLNKKIIYVPDFDLTGLNTCKKALSLGYSISIPKWEKGVKDINDAVVRYGKLPTLLSILQSVTNTLIPVKIKINQIKQHDKL